MEGFLVLRHLAWGHFGRGARMAHVYGKRTGKWMFPKAALNCRRAGRSQWINTPFLHLAPSPRAPQDSVPVACNENLLDNMPIIRFIPFPVSLPYILGLPPKSIICTTIDLNIAFGYRIIAVVMFSISIRYASKCFLYINSFNPIRLTIITSVLQVWKLMQT